jgi:hypothetical protein
VTIAQLKPNFPEPKTNADRIALKAAELLDQDVWERVSDSAVWVRGVRITLDTSSSYVSVPVDPLHEADILNFERPSKEIASIFMTAFSGAMARKREVILVPKVRQISDAAWEQVIASEARKIFWRDARKVAAWVLVCGIALATLIGGIVSCEAAVERAEIADKNQVNAYGFRKGDFVSGKRIEFPRDCAHNNLSTMQACRERFEHWEKNGGNWVEWKDAP